MARDLNIDGDLCIFVQSINSDLQCGLDRRLRHTHTQH